MHFLIDGYNVLHAIGLLSKRRAGPGGLEKARLALLGRLAGALGSQAKQVIVVFDSREPPPQLPSDVDYRGIHVCFASPGESADERIEKLLQLFAPPTVAVVSDDLRLVRAAEKRRSKRFGCEEFFVWAERRRTVPQRKPPKVEPQEKTAGASGATAAEWLKEFEHLERDPTLGSRDAFADLTSEDIRRMLES